MSRKERAARRDVISVFKGASQPPSNTLAAKIVGLQKQVKYLSKSLEFSGPQRLDLLSIRPR
jgi:hypothetical protein